MKYVIRSTALFLLGITSIIFSQKIEKINLASQQFIASLCNLSEAYYDEGQIDNAVQIMEINLPHIISSRDEIKSQGLAQYAKVLYNKHSVQGKSVDLPIEKIEEAIKTAERTNDLHLQAKLYDLMGLALYSRAFVTGDFTLPVTYYEKAIKLRKQLNDKHGESETIFHLGLIEEWGKRLPLKAMEYYRQGMEIAKKGNYKEELAQLSRHVGSVYATLANLDSAQYYFELSLSLRKEVGKKLFLASSYSALAEILIQKKDYKRGALLLTEAIENAKATNATRFLVNALLSYGDLELTLNNKDSAIKYYNDALKVSTESGYTGGVKSSNEKIDSLSKH